MFIVKPREDLRSSAFLFMIGSLRERSKEVAASEMAGNDGQVCYVLIGTCAQRLSKLRQEGRCRCRAGAVN